MTALSIQQRYVRELTRTAEYINKTDWIYLHNSRDHRCQSYISNCNTVVAYSIHEVLLMCMKYVPKEVYGHVSYRGKTNKHSCMCIM